MSYSESGNLVTDEREIAVSESWDSQSDWDANQEQNSVVIENGSIVLDARDPIIDDFEDGDMTEYASDTGAATIQTNFVQNESQALRMDVPDAGRYVDSASGLDRYPSQGDTFRIWVRIESTSAVEPLIGWAVQSEGSSSQNNGHRTESYYAWLRDSNLLLNRGDGSSSTTLDSQSFSPSDNTWYEVEIEWLADGSMTVDVLDAGGTVQASVSGSDTAFSSGGIKMGGNQNNSSGSCWFDYFRVV